MSKSASEKKKEYNMKYRNKLKEQKSRVEEIEEDEIIENTYEIVKKTDEKHKNTVEIQEKQTEEKETVCIDKDAYEYMISLIKKQNENKQEVQKEEPKAPIEHKPVVEDRTSFFFLIKESCKTTLIGLFPILMMQGLAHGARYLKKPEIQQRTNQQSTQQNMQSMEYVIQPQNVG